MHNLIPMTQLHNFIFYTFHLFILFFLNCTPDGWLRLFLSICVEVNLPLPQSPSYTSEWETLPGSSLPSSQTRFRASTLTRLIDPHNCDMQISDRKPVAQMSPFHIFMCGCPVPPTQKQCPGHLPMLPIPTSATAFIHLHIYNMDTTYTKSVSNNAFIIYSDKYS